MVAGGYPQPLFLAVYNLNLRNLITDFIMNTMSKSKSVTNRQFGVILEDINSKFDLVLEGHAALDKKFDKKIDEFKNETQLNFEAIRNELGEFKNETRLNFEAIKEYLSRIDEEIQDIKKTLSGKADLQRLERLEQEVAQIKLVMQQLGHGIKNKE